jgi:hypothetical protein
LAAARAVTSAGPRIAESRRPHITARGSPPVSALDSASRTWMPGPESRAVRIGTDARDSGRWAWPRRWRGAPSRGCADSPHPCPRARRAAAGPGARWRPRFARTRRQPTTRPRPTSAPGTRHAPHPSPPDGPNRASGESRIARRAGRETPRPPHPRPANRPRAGGTWAQNAPWAGVRPDSRGTGMPAPRRRGRIGLTPNRGARSCAWRWRRSARPDCPRPRGS